MDNKISFSFSRRSLKLVLAMAVVVTVLAPVAVIAAGGTFVDDDASEFESSIEWLAANGITSGCGEDTFCPEDNVTRGQMAAFMQRLATKKVVDAATAVTADSLGGISASELLANQPIGVGHYTLPGLAGTGVTGVNSTEPGVYCATMDPELDLTYQDVLVQVSIDWGTSSGYDLFAYWDEANVSCESGQFAVRTYQFAKDFENDVNDVELSDSVAWTYTLYLRPDIVIPVFEDAPDLDTNATD